MYFVFSQADYVHIRKINFLNFFSFVKKKFSFTNNVYNLYKVTTDANVTWNSQETSVTRPQGQDDRIEAECFNFLGPCSSGL